MSGAAPAAPAAPFISLANKEIVCQVAIVSHKSVEGPHNGNILEDFVDYVYINNLHVHSFFCVRDVFSYDRLIKNFRNYVDVVDTEKIKETHVTNAKELSNIQSDLMIIRGHGHKDDDNWPASVSLYDKENYVDCMVYASSARMPSDDCMPMKALTGRSHMVILCSCYGNVIVPRYLEDLTRDANKDRTQSKKQKLWHHLETQEILYFDSDTILFLCPDILVLLMISMADGQWHLPKNTANQRLRPHIIRIMQIVRLFGEDARGFWDFLREIRTVQMFEDIKHEQQTPNQWEKDKYFRTGGHKCTSTLTEDVKSELFANMRSLTLVTWTYASGLRGDLTVTCHTVADIAFAERPEKGQQHVDKFLREYASRNVPGAWPAWLSRPTLPATCTISARAPPALAPLRALLAELRVGHS